MKNLGLAILLMAAVSTVAVAAPCITDTLASYIALGAGGCQISGITFNNFVYAAGGSGVAADFITVEPTAVPITLLFSSAWSVAGGTISPEIGYQVASGGTITGNSLSLALVSGTGESPSFSISELKCLDDLFPACAGGVLVGNFVFLNSGGSSTFDISFFPAPGSIDVLNLMTVTAGGGDLAVLEAFSNRFESIPEPGVAWLAGGGLVLLALLRKKLRTT